MNSALKALSSARKLMQNSYLDFNIINPVNSILAKLYLAHMWGLSRSNFPPQSEVSGGQVTSKDVL